MHGPRCVVTRPHTRAAVRTDDRCVCCLAQRAAGATPLLGPGGASFGTRRCLFWDQEVPLLGPGATPLLGPGGARVLLGSALLSAQMVQVRCWALFAS